ncbi:nitronate monooxygenase, partial [Pseudomonas aeruginosa]
AAVPNAGGLGSIAIAGSAAEKGRALIREVRGLTDKPFNVNLFCHRTGQADPALLGGATGDGDRTEPA